MKNKMKQLFGIILSLVLVLGMAPGMGLTAYADGAYTIKAYDNDYLNIDYGNLAVVDSLPYQTTAKDLMAKVGNNGLGTYYNITDVTLVSGTSVTIGTATGTPGDEDYNVNISITGEGESVIQVTATNNNGPYNIKIVTTSPHSVTLTGGANATPSGGTSQTDLIGEMATVTYTANDNCKFPETSDYYKTTNGITVARTSDTVVTVSGTPTADTTVTVPGALAIISQTVTFKVVNGKWDDGSTEDKTVTLSGLEGDTLKLAADQIPAVGSKPNDTYKAGSWDVTPSTETAITAATTYTYTYAQKASISQTVTFKVVNGSWNDETATDKTVTLTGYEGDTLKLTAAQIPAVGTKPNDGYKAGSWDVTPSTDTAISSNVTYTYTYVADSSGGSSNSGSGDSSGGSSDNTNTNTDTSAKVPYDDVPISTGSVNDITGTASATAESNPFGTKIENNSNLTTLLSLTDAEVAQGVNVWLDIQDMSASVPQTDNTLIQNTSGDYTVGLYLDINLFKKVGGNAATKVTETNGKVKASIFIPESLWKSGRTFEIIRVHDGVATAIAGTYDENTHVFTFKTDKFSTYALAYKDPASSSDSGTTSDSSSSDSSNSTQSTAPKTGDPNDIRVWYLLLIASLGGLGFLGYSKKKKVND